MGFNKDVTLQNGTVGISEYDSPDPSFMETTEAALRQENIIGSTLTSSRIGMSTADFWKVDPEYDPFSEIDGYEEYASRFENAHNRAAVEAIKLDIDKQKKDRDTLSRAGFTGVALSMGASVLDPTILIPGGAAVKAGKIGYSGAKSAAVVGAAAAGGAAAQEVGLHATQDVRTAEESAMAIGGSALLGGLIGFGAAKFMSKTEWDRVSKTLQEEIAEDVPNPIEVTDIMVERMKAQSAGAASVEDIKLDDLGFAGGKAAQAVAKATAAARVNPGIQTMFSPSVKVRETYQQLVDNPVYTRMQMEEFKTLGGAVENNMIALQRGALGSWITDARSNFKKAKKAGFKGTKADFNARVARAARRGDVDELGDKYVTATAKSARSGILDPSLKRLIENGKFDENVKSTTGLSYLTRYWNKQKLVGEEPAFRAMARQYFQEEMMRIPEDQRPGFISKAEMDSHIEDAVSGVVANLTGRGTGEIPDWIVPVDQGPLKGRTFRIPDNYKFGNTTVEDFLENDMEMVMRRYTRTVGAEIELIDKFGRADMKDQFDAITKDYDKLISEAKTPEERTKLSKAMERDMKNLRAFRDMIRGTYRAAEDGSTWSALTRLALTWNYMRLLGGVMLTSITDTSRPIAVHGLRATAREAFPALVSQLKAAKISRSDAESLGAVTDVVMQTRLASLTEINEPYRYGSNYERLLSNASNIFSKATGLSYWNDTMKTISSVMTQNRMARNIMDWSKMSKSERAYMAFLEIDENTAKIMADQIKVHGVQERGIWGADVSKWGSELESADPSKFKTVIKDGSGNVIRETDGVEELQKVRKSIERAKRAWAAALNKDVNRTIITKGVADTPLFMQTNWGKLIFQFKSFGLASHQRALLAGLQENQLRLLESFLVAAPLGMMVSYLKYIERGDTEEAERLTKNPGLWMAEGLDRSGLLTILFEVSNTTEKLGVPFGIKTGMQAVAQDEDRGGSVSRYASRNKLGAVLGPSAGLFQDLATIASALTRADGLKKSEANAMIRQVPGATLPGARSLTHGFIKPALHEALE